MWNLDHTNSILQATAGTPPFLYDDQWNDQQTIFTSLTEDQP